ncbi:MAG: paraquat-inducible protein A, partial [Mariprofundaceae bacterium]|nr:paraquat-inducible protein A [Mariprofundaceae bacterium]
RAIDHGLVQCHTCNLLLPAVHEYCPRCADHLHQRKQGSLTRTWALMATAVLLLFPANLLPIMTVIRFGQGDPSTILGGVVHLIEGGMWPLGLIVFFASIMVPLSKLVALVFLLFSVHRRSSWRPEDRTRLYRMTEVIGSWSMVDIFIIGILTSLVSLDALATIRPGVAASYFAGVVVVTMFAAQSFDPRLIWDAMQEEQDAARVGGLDGRMAEGRAHV